MTGAAHLTFAGTAPAARRVKRAGVVATIALIAANICVGGPLFGIWVGSQAQGATTAPSMSSIAVAVVVLGAVNYGLVALLPRLGSAQDRLASGQMAAPAPVLARPVRRSTAAPDVGPPDEPLVLIEGNVGAPRRSRLLVANLSFGFDVLAAVLPPDGSIDCTVRAMDRRGWATAHLVARPADARAAVELVRLGRARSFQLLETGQVGADPVTQATAIAEYVAFRQPS